MQGALTIDQLAKFNDSQKVKILCLFRHKWAKAYMARVKGSAGTHLCELHTCARCKRFKIGKVVKRMLNRAERRR